MTELALGGLLFLMLLLIFSGSVEFFSCRCDCHDFGFGYCPDQTCSCHEDPMDITYDMHEVQRLPRCGHGRYEGDPCSCIKPIGHGVSHHCKCGQEWKGLK
jgi:hypothetical protein